ncbi:MAG: hypothetical protein K8M05_24230 [Deltaproteobacteria bacterium]|nr:hypothetical protein [Kofleriaceae bacterium]
MTRGAAKHATNPGAGALTLCLFAVLAALASPAAADERPVLVIDATGSDEGRAMVARIEKHLGPDPLLAPVPDLFRLPLAAPTGTDTSWKAEEATLAETRKLLTPIGYRQAAAMAQDAQNRLARFADDPAARALIAELALVQGLAVAGERGLDAARPYFLLVHRLTPGRTLDPGRYPPEVVRTFAESAVTGATGRVTITAVGATEILIDGVVVPGGEPVENHPVPAGPHIITVRGERVVSAGRRIDAIAANTVRVPFEIVEAPLAARLARARDRLVAAREDGARNVAIRDLLGTIKTASHAVVVVREGDGDSGPLAVRLFTDRGALGPPREVGDDVAGAVAPLRPIKKPPPRGPGTGKPGGGGIGRGPEVPPGEPWYRQTWFKATSGTIAGVAAVVLITAIVTRDPGTSTLQGGVDIE